MGFFGLPIITLKFFTFKNCVVVNPILFSVILYSSICDGSGWVPLLLTLMYEYRNEDSKWKPYLELLPNAEEFGHPLFWTVEELEDELKGKNNLYYLK